MVSTVFFYGLFACDSGARPEFEEHLEAKDLGSSDDNSKGALTKLHNWESEDYEVQIRLVQQGKT